MSTLFFSLWLEETVKYFFLLLLILNYQYLFLISLSGVLKPTYIKVYLI